MSATQVMRAAHQRTSLNSSSKHTVTNSDGYSLLYRDNLSQLAAMARQDAEALISGQHRLLLPSSMLAVLNKMLQEEDELEANLVPHTSDSNLAPNSGDGHLAPNSSAVVTDLKALKDLVSRAPRLKVTHSAEVGSVPINLTLFSSLTTLELSKVAVDRLVGLRRNALEVLVCSRCLTGADEILNSSGGDDVTTWDALKKVNLSYNRITMLQPHIFARTPWLEHLDLSCNQLKDARALDTLDHLKYLNLSFNCLETFPTFNELTGRRLQVLLLGHNFIDDLLEVWRLENLTCLDVSHNCLPDHTAVAGLLALSSLRRLDLQGNPLGHHPTHRLLTAAYLRTTIAPYQFVLDGVSLNRTEQSVLGVNSRLSYRNLDRARQHVATSTPVSPTESQDIGSGSAAAGVRRKLHSASDRSVGKGGRRIRQVVIVDGTDTGPDAGLSNRATSQSDLSEAWPDHLETKKQVEGLRERFGEEHWLHSHAGTFIQDLMGLQRTPPPFPSSSPFHSEAPLMQSTPRVEEMVVGSQPVTSGESVSPIPSPSVVVLHDGPAATTNRDTSSSVAPPCAEESVEGGTEEGDITAQEKEEDEEPMDGEMIWLVEKTTSDGESEDIFVVMNSRYLVEKDTSSGRVITKWMLDSVQACTKSASDPPTLQLEFDTVRRDRKVRHYIMELADAQALLTSIKAILESRTLSAMNQVIFGCMKCSAQYTVETCARGDVAGRTCPSCGSNYVFQVEEPPQLSVQEPQPPGSGANAATSAAMAADQQQLLDDSPSQCSIGSAASLQEQGIATLEEIPTPPRRCDSDIEVISNPSQSSIEVLESTRLQTAGGGSTPSRKRSSEERQTVAVPQLAAVPEAPLTTAPLTESSSSGSLTDSVCTAYETQQQQLAPNAVQQARLSSAKEETVQEAGEEERAAAVQPTDYASVLQGLLSSVSAKLTRSDDVPPGPTHATAASLYSYTDLAAIDHRIKLYLYQSIMQTDGEEVSALLRCCVWHEGGLHYPGCLLLSTHHVFLLRVVGDESREEACDWLAKVVDHPRSDLTALYVLPCDQGLGMQLAGRRNYLLVLHDSHRTTSAFAYIRGLRLGPACQLTGAASENTVLALQQVALSASSTNQHRADPTVLHFSIATRVIVARDGAPTEDLSLACIALTRADLILLPGDLDWLLTTGATTRPTPLPRAIQSLSNLIEIALGVDKLELHFLDDCIGCEEVWSVVMETEASMQTIVETVRSPWELLFGVPLQVTKATP